MSFWRLLPDGRGSVSLENESYWLVEIGTDTLSTDNPVDGTSFLIGERVACPLFKEERDMERTTKMTDAERKLAVDRLHTSRDKFMSVIDGVSAAQATFKPTPEQWSILELAEHIAISDKSLRGLIRRALEAPAQPELMGQVQANDYRYHREFRPHPKGVNKAPESMCPHNRFAAL